MIQRDRPFEKRLRERVRETIRGSESLRREYRRENPRLKRTISENWSGRAVQFGFSTAIILAALHGHDGPGVAFALLVCWFSGTISASMSALNGQLWNNASLLAFYHLPARSTEIFTFLFGRIWRRALRESFVYIGVGMALSWQLSQSPIGFVALLALPILQYLLGFVTAIHLAAWLPRWGNVYWIGYLLAWSILIGEKRSLAWVDAILQTAWFLPPIGWTGFIAHRIAEHQEYHTLLALLPVGALIAALPVSLKRLRDAYDFGEPVRFHELVSEASDELQVDRMGPTELHESVVSGAALQTTFLIPHTGWMERWVSAWWTPRERLIAEILCDPNPGWSGAFRRMGICFVPALIVILIWGNRSPWIPMLSLVIPAMVGLPLFGGIWRGLAAISSGGNLSPLIAYLPIRFSEAARVLIKANLIRNLLGAPLLLALAVACSWANLNALGPGFDYGLRGLALYFALFPLSVLGPFGIWRRSNQSLNLKALMVALPLALLLVAAGVGVFVSTSLLQIAGSVLFAAVISWLCYFLFARGWNRGWFDLIESVPVGAGDED